MIQNSKWWKSIVGGETREELYQSFKKRQELDAKITLLETFNLPTLGDRYPVNTGLARHPSGNGWLVGDDGRTLTGKTTDGGVIWYNDDFTTIIDNFKTIGHFKLTNQHSIQGISVVDGSNEFWCVARKLNSGHSTVIRANATTGEVISSSLCQNTGNGIAVVPERGFFYTLQITGELTKWDLNGVHLPPIIDLNSSSSNDMLHYLGNNRMLLTYGDNGTNGVAVLYDISGSKPVIIRTMTIPSANAIEGVCVYDGYIWVNNDGQYHGQKPALNRVLKYSLGGLTN